MSFFNWLFITLAHAQGTGQVVINPNIPGSVPVSAGPIAVVFNFYQYALMGAGLIAFAMIVYAGIKYSLAAGNPSGQSDAKNQIFEALLGLLLLLGAYVVLITINPDLVRLSLPALEKIGLVSDINRSPIVNTSSTGRGGTCNPAGGPFCSPAMLKAAGCVGNSGCSGDQGIANLASVISYDSSGCNAPNTESATDKCADGASVSWGMGQLYMLTEANAVGGPCSGLVARVNGEANCPAGAGICLWQGDGRPSQSCINWVVNSRGVRYCANYACRVTNQAKFQACKSYVTGSAAVQLRRICQLYNSRCYNPWLNSKNHCGL